MEPESRDSPGEIERAFAELVDRANRGDPLEESAIRERWPALAGELLSAYRDFLDLASVPSIHRRLGRFELRREIGRGGMGVVYEAYDASLDRVVALKLLPAARAIDESAVARFRREARIAARLRHPNVVTVHETGVVEGTPYIAMELVDGSGLETFLAARHGPNESANAIRHAISASSETSDLPASYAKPSASDATLAPIASGPAPISPADGDPARDPSHRSPSIRDPATCDLRYCLRMAGLFADVAEGLHCAHEHGIVHRDLKPSNLILERGRFAGKTTGAESGVHGERLRLLDFGLARLEGKSDITRSHEILGTPRYMSPEQIHGDADGLDRASDIYSLGATLYETLCLSPPFDGRNPTEILSRIASAEPRSLRRLNSRVPRDLETVVLKCLEKKPEHRYRTAEALAQELRRVVRGDPIEARPQGLFERLARRAWRRRGRFAAGLAAAVLVALVVWLLVARRDESVRRAEAEYDRKLDAAVALLELGEVMSAALDVVETPFGYDVQRSIRGLEDQSESDPVRAALEELNALVLTLPDRPEGHYERGRAFDLLGRAEDAERSFSTAAERGDHRAMVRLAEIHAARGEESDAARQLEEAGRRSTRAWVEAWIAAREAQRESRWELAAGRWEALIHLERALADPARATSGLGERLSVESSLACAISHLRLEDLDGARRHFSMVSGMRPRAIEPELLVAFVDYLAAKRRKDASAFEAAMRRFEEISDRDAAAVAWIVPLLFGHAEDPARTLEWVRRLPAGIERDLWEAACLSLLDRSAEALEAVERLESHQPTITMAVTIAAITYLNLGRFQDSAECAERAAKLSPDSSFPLQILGSAYSLAGDYRRGMEAYLRATQVEPSSPSAWFYLGMGLYFARQYAAAVGPLARSTQLGNANTAGIGAYSHETAFLFLGAARYHHGAHDAAIDAFERGLALSAERGEATDPQWLVVFARALMKEGRAIDAVLRAEEACAHPLTHGAFGTSAREVLEEAARAALPVLLGYSSVDLAVEAARSPDASPFEPPPREGTLLSPASPEAIAARVDTIRIASARVPSTALAAYLAARVLALAGRPHEALERASLAAREDPAASAPRLLIAELLVALDRREEAREELERLLAASCPGAERAWNAWWKLAAGGESLARALLARLPCPAVPAGPPRAFATNDGRTHAEALREILAAFDEERTASLPLTGAFAVSETQVLIPLPAGRYRLSIHQADGSALPSEESTRVFGEGPTLREPRDGFLELTAAKGPLLGKGWVLWLSAE